jgi:hypothetical protein
VKDAGEGWVKDGERSLLPYPNAGSRPNSFRQYSYRFLVAIQLLQFPQIGIDLWNKIIRFLRYFRKVKNGAGNRFKNASELSRKNRAEI